MHETQSCLPGEVKEAKRIDHSPTLTGQFAYTLRRKDWIMFNKIKLNNLKRR